ncbi:hypothetical protein BLNAU_7358 [Blattamonas nauphoetae]|uniref:IC97/Casc1 N-terminal domain-containing protein n=1 Tax=Blattamonas nauphoetae TaxID=2049346 RepID=A0ABQ9Y1T1_9EUKA|nr:hypothetical protein BLNAU_7358 [Blattamonas nauphoetae]
MSSKPNSQSASNTKSASAAGTAKQNSSGSSSKPAATPAAVKTDATGKKKKGKKLSKKEQEKLRLLAEQAAREEEERRLAEEAERERIRKIQQEEEEKRLRELMAKLAEEEAIRMKEEQGEVNAFDQRRMQMLAAETAIYNAATEWLSFVNFGRDSIREPSPYAFSELNSLVSSIKDQIGKQSSNPDSVLLPVSSPYLGYPSYYTSSSSRPLPSFTPQSVFSESPSGTEIPSSFNPHSLSYQADVITQAAVQSSLLISLAKKCEELSYSLTTDSLAVQLYVQNPPAERKREKYGELSLEFRKLSQLLLDTATFSFLMSAEDRALELQYIGESLSGNGKARKKSWKPLPISLGLVPEGRKADGIGLPGSGLNVFDEQIVKEMEKEEETKMMREMSPTDVVTSAETKQLICFLWVNQQKGFKGRVFEVTQEGVRGLLDESEDEKKLKMRYRTEEEMQLFLQMRKEAVEKKKASSEEEFTFPELPQSLQSFELSAPAIHLPRTRIFPPFSVFLNVPKSLMMMSFGFRVIVMDNDLLSLNPPLPVNLYRRLINPIAANDGFSFDKYAQMPRNSIFEPFVPTFTSPPPKQKPVPEKKQDAEAVEINEEQPLSSKREQENLNTPPQTPTNKDDDVQEQKPAEKTPTPQRFETDHPRTPSPFLLSQMNPSLTTPLRPELGQEFVETEKERDPNWMALNLAEREELEDGFWFPVGPIYHTELFSTQQMLPGSTTQTLTTKNVNWWQIRQVVPVPAVLDEIVEKEAKKLDALSEKVKNAKKEQAEDKDADKPEPLGDSNEKDEEVSQSETGGDTKDGNEKDEDGKSSEGRKSRKTKKRSSKKDETENTEETNDTTQNDTQEDVQQENKPENDPNFEFLPENRAASIDLPSLIDTHILSGLAYPPLSGQAIAAQAQTKQANVPAQPVPNTPNKPEQTESTTRNGEEGGVDEDAQDSNDANVNENTPEEEEVPEKPETSLTILQLKDILPGSELRIRLPFEEDRIILDRSLFLRTQFIKPLKDEEDEDGESEEEDEEEEVPEALHKRTNKKTDETTARKSMDSLGATERSREEDHEETQAEAPPAKVTSFSLSASESPSVHNNIPPPVVGWWDPQRGKWCTDGVTDVICIDEEEAKIPEQDHLRIRQASNRPEDPAPTEQPSVDPSQPKTESSTVAIPDKQQKEVNPFKYVTFSTIHFTAHSILLPQTHNLPYTSWRLHPLTTDCILFHLETPFFGSILFEIHQKTAVLVYPRHKAFEDILDIPMAPRRLLRTLKERGLNVMPSETSLNSLTPPIKLKHTPTEAELHHLISVCTPSFAFSSSALNSISSYSEFVFRATEWTPFKHPMIYGEEHPQQSSMEENHEELIGMTQSQTPVVQASIMISRPTTAGTDISIPPSDDNDQSELLFNRPNLTLMIEGENGEPEMIERIDEEYESDDEGDEAIAPPNPVISALKRGDFPTLSPLVLPSQKKVTIKRIDEPALAELVAADVIVPQKSTQKKQDGTETPNPLQPETIDIDADDDDASIKLATQMEYENRQHEKAIREHLKKEHGGSQLGQTFHPPLTSYDYFSFRIVDSEWTVPPIDDTTEYELIKAEAEQKEDDEEEKRAREMRLELDEKDRRKEEEEGLDDEEKEAREAIRRKLWDEWEADLQKRKEERAKERRRIHIKGSEWFTVLHERNNCRLIKSTERDADPYYIEEPAPQSKTNSKPPSRSASTAPSTTGSLQHADKEDKNPDGGDEDASDNENLSDDSNPPVRDVSVNHDIIDGKKAHLTLLNALKEVMTPRLIPSGYVPYSSFQQRGEAAIEDVEMYFPALDGIEGASTLLALTVKEMMDYVRPFTFTRYDWSVKQKEAEERQKQRKRRQFEIKKLRNIVQERIRQEEEQRQKEEEERKIQEEAERLEKEKAQAEETKSRVKSAQSKKSGKKSPSPGKKKK